MLQLGFQWCIPRTRGGKKIQPRRWSVGEVMASSLFLKFYILSKLSLLVNPHLSQINISTFSNFSCLRFQRLVSGNLCSTRSQKAPFFPENLKSVFCLVKVYLVLLIRSAAHLLVALPRVRFILSISPQ